MSRYVARVPVLAMGDGPRATAAATPARHGVEPLWSSGPGDATPRQTSGGEQPKSLSAAA